MFENPLLLRRSISTALVVLLGIVCSGRTHSVGTLHADTRSETVDQVRAAEADAAVEVIDLNPSFAVPTSDEADDAAIEPEAPPTVFASETALRSDDELWFVSSRCASCEADGSVRLHYWRYEASGRWRTASLDELLAADTTLPTCLHVHGNRVDCAQANCGGWRYFQSLVNGCTERPPLRFVIFSWPSEQTSNRNIPDTRTKAVRAECHAYYLAWLVDRLPQDARLSMIGYSYGARVIGGTLHLLGGGRLQGRSLGNRASAQPRSVRAVFLAAALDDDHFAPGRCFECASTQIERLLIARNPCDRALKWYANLYHFTLRPRRGQQAMGYAGLAGLNCLPQLRGRIETIDVSGLVGRAHEWHGFEHLCGNFLERMRQYVHFEPLDAHVVARETPASHK